MNAQETKYQEPWELVKADAQMPKKRAKQLFFLGVVAPTIALAVFVGMNTTRSNLEEDIEAVYYLTNSMHRESELSEIPIDDVAQTVQTFVAAQRVGAIDSPADVLNGIELSLAGQKKAVVKLTKMYGAQKIDRATAFSTQVEDGIAKMSGGSTITAEQSVYFLERLGLSADEIDAFLKQKLFETNTSVYEYQLSLIDERRRLRQELHELPLGWLRARIRGTYKYIDVAK